MMMEDEDDDGDKDKMMIRIIAWLGNDMFLTLSTMQQDPDPKFWHQDFDYVKRVAGGAYAMQKNCQL